MQHKGSNCLKEKKDLEVKQPSCTSKSINDDGKNNVDIGDAFKKQINKVEHHQQPTSSSSSSSSLCYCRCCYGISSLCFLCRITMITMKKSMIIMILRPPPPPTDV
mmetsp:Transcript_23413/g.37629  ORF Transcript_23413/g.37629 Transcript_23413/m.37629 type:complete len:106 (-) Transcript_23413:50-367(-)